MSEAEYYWPLSGDAGTYFVWEGGCPYEWKWDGVWHSPEEDVHRTTQQMVDYGYLGVRREAAKPVPTDDEKFAALLKRAAAEVKTWPAWRQDTLGWWRDEEQDENPANTHTPTPKSLTPDPDDGNAMVAQQALDEWRACKQQPKAADWAYRWAVDLCERLGAR